MTFSKFIVNALAERIIPNRVLTISVHKYVGLFISDIKRSNYPESDVKVPGF